jgi:hypothetical protein
MVSDDDIDAVRAKRAHSGARRSSAVTRHEHGRASFHRCADTGVSEIVPVREPPRNERYDLRAKFPESDGKDGRGADTVDVVVAVNHHGFASAGSLRKTIDCLPHTSDLERIV